MVLLLHRRSELSAEYANAAAAGLLFGVGSLLLKICLEAVKSERGGFSVGEPGALGALFLQPYLYLCIATNIVGLACRASAFSVGRVSLVAPTVAALSLTTVVALGLGLLGESLDMRKLIGLLLVRLGGVVVRMAGAEPLRSPSGPAAERHPVSREGSVSVVGPSEP